MLLSSDRWQLGQIGRELRVFVNLGVFEFDDNVWILEISGESTG